MHACLEAGLWAGGLCAHVSMHRYMSGRLVACIHGCMHHGITVCGCELISVCMSMHLCFMLKCMCVCVRVPVHIGWLLHRAVHTCYVCTCTWAAVQRSVIGWWNGKYLRSGKSAHSMNSACLFRLLRVRTNIWGRHTQLQRRLQLLVQSSAQKAGLPLRVSGKELWDFFIWIPSCLRSLTIQSFSAKRGSGDEESQNPLKITQQSFLCISECHVV